MTEKTQREAVKTEDVGDVRLSLMSDGTYKLAVTDPSKTVNVMWLFPGGGKTSRANLGFRLVPLREGEA